ncbi:ComEC/Rec2 family competence protein [Sphingopyxis sp.]|uniref:ComEC/Rec2 family competence protein n=1 Tax=Sphingopyxis sp. TaxID=1908224 RepID=UPI002D78E56E|nr:MBL fold metallo-hydrolase [Sphingopyxis sp.]HET6523181.1 MBL fold metallo-hydrolase [Sphingopyxis sp.]
MSVFRLTMLPASEGDCLILSYGPEENVLRHIVIDGGRKATWPRLKTALATIAARGEEVELLLLTHIDADHIDGLVELVTDSGLPLVPKTIWYNGYEQLKTMVPPGGLQPFGFKAADAYSKALAAKGWPINEAFGGKSIFTEGQPTPFLFAGLTLTLISPDRAKLDKLRNDWRKALAPPPPPAAAHAGGKLEAFGKRPMPATLDVEKLSAASGIDKTAPNGSSIAMIAEYDGRSVLLGADAHPDVVLENLTALTGDAKRCRIDLVKLPHHGSRANITREIIETLDCDRFAISTSGSVFGHPDPEAISRILKFGSNRQKTLYFNYASERTLPWNDADLKKTHGYDCVYPASEGASLEIDI